MPEGGGPPFFIVGSARSGTTLLRLMLNAHRDVAVPPESRFVVELYRGTYEVAGDEFLRSLAGHPRFRAWDLSIELVRDELGEGSSMGYADAIATVFRAYARLHGKSRWGDKTPRYVEDIPLLARLFPEARFLHLIRDGRNVALSYADVPFGPKTVGKAAKLWSTRVCAGYTDGRRLPPGRYIEIRYEDLVEDALGEAKDICEFLELDFDPGMLEYTEKSGAVLPRASTFNPHVTEPPQQNVRSWSDSMPGFHIEVFEAVAGDVLSELGYERRFPEPGAKAKLIASLSAAGIPVAKIRSTR